MQKRSLIMLVLAVFLLIGLAGHTFSQQGLGRGPHMMDRGKTGGTWPSAGPHMWTMMEPQMMGQWGQGMGHSMGMMGGMMSSPKLRGAMLSMQGEMMTLMGSLTQKYAPSSSPWTAENQEDFQKELFDDVGKILSKYGAQLQQEAKRVSK